MNTIKKFIHYYGPYKKVFRTMVCKLGNIKKITDQQLSFSYYSQNNSGQMMSKLVSDLFDISEFAHHGPENLFISLVKIK